MLRKLIFFAAVAGISLSTFAELSAQGIKADFTERNGARAIGMGHAFTGVAEGMPTVLWNPAGLASLTRTELYFSRYNGWSFTTRPTSPPGSPCRQSARRCGTQVGPSEIGRSG